jgi:uncharacterized membrane protein
MHNEQGDQRIDLVLGNLLRVGVILSASTIVFGGVLNFLRHGHEAVEYATFHGEPAALRGLHGILEAAMAAQGKGIIQLGLIFLVAVPVLRVAASVVMFLQRRDLTYVIFTLIVLCILTYSLFFASA